MRGGGGLEDELENHRFHARPYDAGMVQGSGW